MTYNPTEKTKGEAVRYALSMSKRPHFASGGVVGPLLGSDGGRTDTLPISVPSGAYVVPADVVSGLPGAEGNSLAGHQKLAQLFSKPPFMPDKAPYGAISPKLGVGHSVKKPKMADGGEIDADGQHVDIMAAGGEFVVHPDIVKQIGDGDIKRGHDILDMFIKECRKRNIKDLQKLPGPVKRGDK